MDISNIPDRQFKIMIIKILIVLQKRVEESVRPLTKRLKRNYQRLRTQYMKLKIQLDGINNRLDEAEEQIGDLEDNVMESNQAEQVKKKNVQNEGRLRELSNSIKHNNSHYWDPKRRRERKRYKNYLNK